MTLYRRSKPASFELTMSLLCQAPPIGRLCRASRLPFRGSYFTVAGHPAAATPQRHTDCLYSQWGYGFMPIRPFPHHAFVTHSGVVLDEVRAAREAARTAILALVEETAQKQFGGWTADERHAAFLLIYHSADPNGSPLFLTPITTIFSTKLTSPMARSPVSKSKFSRGRADLKTPANISRSTGRAVTWRMKKRSG